MQAGVVVALIIGWSLVLAQPLFGARKRKDYLRSIVAFRQQLVALEMGIQRKPGYRPVRPYPAAPLPSYRRRQRTLVYLVLSLVIGLMLTAVATPVGVLLTTISLLSIAAFLTLVRAATSVAKGRLPNASRGQVMRSRSQTSEPCAHCSDRTHRA